MATEFKMPELGENIEQADVVKVLVAEGDVIKVDQTVLELETDKAAVELPSAYAGRVVKVHVKDGDQVPVGAVLLTVEEAPSEGDQKSEPVEAKVVVAEGKEPEAKEAEPTEPEAPEVEKKAPAKGPQPEGEPSRGPAPASPSVRQMARKLGIDLHQVSGSGAGGRIVVEDVQRHVRELATAATTGPIAAAGAPSLPDFGQWGPIERQRMSGIRRKTAENVSVAWRNVPQVTQYDLADITELEAARKRYRDTHPDGVKLTVTAMVLKAVVAALKAYPQCNASVDPTAGELILKRYYHIGVAVDTEHGLIVPVIRDVDRKSVLELATELDEVAERARQRKIELDQLQGGTFTITNLGGIGGTAFSPIVNFPQVAILGLARSRQEQVIRDGKAELRLMLPLCLSYDHRAVDGADGARFLIKLAGALSDPLSLILEG
ncbi:MAG TPA: dihydrolipoamide acetyltransferase family protein [Phycisphaerae bacterium]|nr:dihydrolipoamide acetyltransferase family protein [Phycisphaerae bacterium]